LENYWLLQERQPEIGGALSRQRMLAFFLSLADAEYSKISVARSISAGSALYTPATYPATRLAKKINL